MNQEPNATVKKAIWLLALTEEEKTKELHNCVESLQNLEPQISKTVFEK